MKLIILFLSFLISRFTLPLFLQLMYESNYLKRNFLGDLIPNSMGIFYIINILILSPFFFLFSEDTLFISLGLLGMFVMGFVGIIDDFIGNRRVSGLKGHISMLFNRKLTTGGIKAIIGCILALLISLIVSTDIISGILNFLLISLFSNFINLLDLRPGRAIKIYLLFAVIFVFAINTSIEYLLICSIGISLVYFPYDIKGKTMLGDTGSNSLGVILGITSTFLPFITKLLLLSFLILAHLYSEKKSITNLIGKNRLLNYIDNLGR